MGCVRFTERFLGSGKLSRDNISACKRSIQEQLAGYSFAKESNSRLIGVAGTVTSLASVDQGLAEYDSARMDGHRLSLEDSRSVIKRFRGLLPDEIQERYPQALAGRADIIFAGLLILEAVMQHSGFNELTVSTGGIRHGALMKNIQ